MFSFTKNQHLGFISKTKVFFLLCKFRLLGHKEQKESQPKFFSSTFCGKHFGGVFCSSYFSWYLDTRRKAFMTLIHWNHYWKTIFKITWVRKGFWTEFLKSEKRSFFWKEKPRNTFPLFKLYVSGFQNSVSNYSSADHFLRRKSRINHIRWF